MLDFEYKIVKFDKLIEFDGYYVVKFKAEVIKNGESLIEQYREEGLDKKYENKEATASGGSGQYSAPLFGDMKEENEGNLTELNFNKSTFDPNNKTFTAAYKIIDDSQEKFIEVLNIQETEYKNLMFVSGHIAYTIKIYKFRLPKSQIKILEDDTKHEGFKFIEIPYWLVKKEPEQYKIKR
jgi:hypothetical protein